MKHRKFVLILLVASFFVSLAWSGSAPASPVKTVLLKVSLPSSGG